MAKSYDDQTNEVLRELARKVKRERFDDNQTKMAEGLGVSGAFLSDFINEKRGAGLDMLVGLGKFAPLDLLQILEIDPAVVVMMTANTTSVLEAGLMSLPDGLRRAARACIELTGCTPAEAGDAAVEAFDLVQAAGKGVPDDPDYWLQKIRDIVKARAKSGERASVRLLTAKQEP
jgi:hypothetical protein